MEIYIKDTNMFFGFYIIELNNNTSKFHIQKYSHIINLDDFFNYYGAIDRISMK